MHESFYSLNFSKHWSIPQRLSFCNLSQKISDGKRDTLPVTMRFFSIPELFWNTRVPPPKIFGTVTPRKSKKPWCPHPPPMHESFYYLNFSKHWSIPQRLSFCNLSQKISDGRRDTLPVIHEVFFHTRTFLKYKGTPSENFRYCDTKKIEKTVMPPSPSYAWKFFFPEFFETLKHSPEVVFLQSESKNFRRKTWYPPCYPWGFFPYQNISEIRGYPNEFFRYCEKKIRENLDFPTSPPMHGNSFSRNFRKTERFFHEVFRHCQTKQFGQKNVILSLFSIFFTHQNVSEIKGSSLRKFLVLRDKKIPIKTWCPPPMHETFHHQTFFETQKGSTTRFFGTVRQISSDGKTWYLPSCPMYIFHTGTFLTQKGPPTYFFGTVRQNNWQNRDSPNLPLLCMKIFSNRIFSKHRRFPLSFFSGTVRKIPFDGKTWYPSFYPFFSIPKHFRNTKVPIPPLLCMISLTTRSFSKQRSVPLRIFSALWDKKNQREKRDTFPLSHILASLTKFFWNTRVLPTEVFGTVRLSVLLGFRYC